MPRHFICDSLLNVDMLIQYIYNADALQSIWIVIKANDHVFSYE